jgi:hypothetical protein
MGKINGEFKDYSDLLYRWIRPIVDPFKVIRGLSRYTSFLKSWVKYSRMESAESIKILNTYPCLHDKTKISGFDAQYFYQDIWTFKRIYESKVGHHVDVGSRVDFVGLLTAITTVTFIDIRPLKAKLNGLVCKEGSILSIPFNDNTISSLSCLHVAEHIGLGRYDDLLDPLGTKKAAEELSRVLAVDGNLYFSVPVGKPRLCFNAHRIHSPGQIISYFQDLNLVELSGIDDLGVFTQNISIDTLEKSNYACGLFWFKKER